MLRRYHQLQLFRVPRNPSGDLKTQYLPLVIVEDQSLTWCISTYTCENFEPSWSSTLRDDLEEKTHSFQASGSSQSDATRVFFHILFATSTTNWVQIFTGLLFCAYLEIHKVRILVFDNYQRCPVSLKQLSVIITKRLSTPIKTINALRSVYVKALIEWKENNGNTVVVHYFQRAVKWKEYHNRIKNVNELWIINEDCTLYFSLYVTGVVHGGVGWT